MRSLRLRMSRCSSAVGRRGGCSPGIVNHARTAHERPKIAHLHHQALTGRRGRERGRPRFGTAGVVCRSARCFLPSRRLWPGFGNVFSFAIFSVSPRGWPLSIGATASFASASARRRCFCAWTRPPACPAANAAPMGLAIGDPQSGERTPRTVFSACAAWRNARKRH